MHHDWIITANISWPNGELMNKDEPFGDYHVEADTAEEAIEILKNDFNGCHVEIFGNPTHQLISDEEYNEDEE